MSFSRCNKVNQLRKFKRGSHIVNHLIGLGKDFDKDEHNIKVLKCFDRSWQPKVTTMPKSRDLSTMTTTAVFGKLKEHEIKMNRLNKQESSEKMVKNMTLKSNTKKIDKIEEEVDESTS